MTTNNATYCTVNVLDRDGKIKTVSMTLNCFEASKARFNSFAADQFLGQLATVNGVEVVADQSVPF
jgi:hypothetical protein